jgi:hypothetical protein
VPRPSPGSPPRSSRRGARRCTGPRERSYRIGSAGVSTERQHVHLVAVDEHPRERAGLFVGWINALVLEHQVVDPAQQLALGAGPRGRRRRCRRRRLASVQTSSGPRGRLRVLNRCQGMAPAGFTGGTAGWPVRGRGGRLLCARVRRRPTRRVRGVCRLGSRVAKSSARCWRWHTSSPDIPVRESLPRSTSSGVMRRISRPSIDRSDGGPPSAPPTLGGAGVEMTVAPPSPGC